MKASWFTEAQRAFVLKQGEKGTPVAETHRKIEDCRRRCSKKSPHNAIGYNVPIAMHYRDDLNSPSS